MGTLNSRLSWPIDIHHLPSAFCCFSSLCTSVVKVGEAESATLELCETGLTTCVLMQVKGCAKRGKTHFAWTPCCTFASSAADYCTLVLSRHNINLYPSPHAWDLINKK